MADALARNFGSDNVTPACAPILAAIKRQMQGPAALLRRGPVYRALDRCVRGEVFETEPPIYPVTTGTAANALALRSSRRRSAASIAMSRADRHR